MSRKIHGVKIRCPHCNKNFEVIMPTPPLLAEPQNEEEE